MTSKAPPKDSVSKAPSGRPEIREIQVLPQALADQIAAGEVVERPASVVKELCENALDAGATRIEIEAESGGSSLLRVTDDGCGMSAKEAPLALKRHATSKIAVARDLERIHTLGFRGEALPSIASVSRLELVTRRRRDDAGVRVTTQGGREPETGATGCAPGTRLTVRDLFYNVPARKKFLKTPKTEGRHINETVVRLALTHPEVHFRLSLDGRSALELPAHPDLQGRAEAVLSRRAKGSMFPGHVQLESTQVTALLAAPAAAVGTSRWCYLFVNGRFVRDRMLLRTLVSGHGEALPSGRYPVAVVHVEIPPELVDVNVHPQKTEVRFVEGRRVAAAVHKAVGATVSEAPWSLSSRTYVLNSDSSLSAADSSQGDARRRVQEALTSYSQRGGSGGRLGPPTKSSQGSFVGGAAPKTPRPRTPPKEPGPGDRSSPSPSSRGAPPRAWFEPRGGTEPIAPGPSPEAGLRMRSSRLGELVYLGQTLKTFLLFEGSDGLVILDQHAVHERINYNRLMDSLGSGDLPSQRLLVPERVELSAESLEILDERAKDIRRLGFEVEPFGGGSVALKAVPVRLSREGGDGVAAFLEVLDDLSVEDEGGEGRQTSTLEGLVATLACHASIRAGQSLSPKEVSELLAALDATTPWDHCPHGRPVVSHLSEAELRRRFARE